MRVESTSSSSLLDDSSVRKRQNSTALRVFVQVGDKLLEVCGGGCRVAFENGHCRENLRSSC